MLLRPLLERFGLSLIETTRIAQISTSFPLCGLLHFCSDLTKRDLVVNSHPGGLKEEGFRSIIDLPNVVYAGFDASADSLHVGNLSIINSLLRAILHGCNSIALVGQTTAVAGDPSGHRSAREFKTRDVIATNAVHILSQLKKVASNFCEYYGKEYEKNLFFVNNADWYKKMSLEEYLELGHMFRVGDMHRLAAVKTRMRSGLGIDYSEFSYQNLQAMDWLQLAQTYNCYFQIGGSDQLGNFDAGYDHIRKVTGKLSAGLGLLLITDGKGEKLGKSVMDPNASLWLDESKTSPYAFFQFWRQLPDKEATLLLSLVLLKTVWQFSLKPLECISALLIEHEAKLGQWVAQKHLAIEMTRLVHGETGLTFAQRCTKALFENALDELADFSDSTIEKLFGKASTRYVARTEVSTIGQLADLVKSGKPSGLQVMAAGGLKLNGKRYADPSERINFEKLRFCGRNFTILCWGKRHYQLVVWLD